MPDKSKELESNFEATNSYNSYIYYLIFLDFSIVPTIQIWKDLHKLIFYRLHCFNPIFLQFIPNRTLKLSIHNKATYLICWEGFFLLFSQNLIFKMIDSVIVSYEGFDTYTSIFLFQVSQKNRICILLP